LCFLRRESQIDKEWGAAPKRHGHSALGMEGRARRFRDYGNLKFPAVYESSLTRLTPMELVIAQSLHAKVDGEEFMFWVNTKFDPKENAEFKGRPTVLTCDLSKEMKTTREFGSIMYTLCTWE